MKNNYYTLTTDKIKENHKCDTGKNIELEKKPGRFPRYLNIMSKKLGLSFAIYQR